MGEDIKFLDFFYGSFFKFQEKLLIFNQPKLMVLSSATASIL